MEIGRELVAAKKITTHGQFVSWVEREVGITARTAQHIMAAYKFWLKNENFSHLPRSVLYLLAAGDVPATTLAAIDRRIEAGDPPSYFEVKQMVKKPSAAVEVAIKMEKAPSQPKIVSLQAVRTIKETEERHPNLLANVQGLLTSRDPKVHENVQALRDRVKLADVATMVCEVLDDQQLFRLITLLRRCPEDFNLRDLAVALETARPSSRCS
jgi:hypothetical protein